MSQTITISISITVPSSHQETLQIHTPVIQRAAAKPQDAPVKSRPVLEEKEPSEAVKAARALFHEMRTNAAKFHCDVDRCMRSNSCPDSIDLDLYRKVTLFKGILGKNGNPQQCSYFHAYEDWVDQLTEKEKSNMNRYQRMVRFVEDCIE